MIKYFSMFSGIGGFEYGLQQAEQEFTCIGYSEIDKYAVSIYEKHYTKLQEPCKQGITINTTLESIDCGKYTYKGGVTYDKSHRNHNTRKEE